MVLIGITTGFGGSAAQRSTKTLDLQRAVVQHQHSGILPVTKQAGSIRATFNHSAGADFMPEAWVRGAMLVRCKSLLAGHSGVRFEIIEMLMAFLNNDLVPLVPLRGSVSASGDLQPLSYIAGALEGNPDIYLWTDDGKGGRELISADVALDLLKRQSIVFAPKEALGVLNGTAISTAVGALALQESHHLAAFAQVLTAMGVEALLGSVGSFNDFFSQVRPHRGQAEVAKNIRGFLRGSKLARPEDADDECPGGLKQDRYALRTSPQWIGPQLEDLALAHEQITIECNSTTDNPLIDVEGDTIHHGGNFQAVSITSAMEKTRLSLQMFGRMLFSQCTELINPDLNSGLPPNLAADEPSTSYTMKGADINVAAYMSELAFLANPVSSHVQTAEMGNQAINSLALISARYTHTAIDTLSMICATYLYALCQALDLRAMDLQFRTLLPASISTITTEIFSPAFPASFPLLSTLHPLLHSTILTHLLTTTRLDSPERFHQIAHSAQSPLTTYLSAHRSSVNPAFDVLGSLERWTNQISSTLCTLFNTSRDSYLAQPDATPYLGAASKVMYRYVRGELGVPMHRGLVDHPGGGNGRKTIGSNVSAIYEEMRRGELYGVVVGCLRENS